MAAVEEARTHDFTKGELVRIDGLVSASEHNGRLARVLAAFPARPAPEAAEDRPAAGTAAAGLERVPVQLCEGSRAKLRVRPANLRVAYDPVPFQMVCAGDASLALSTILSVFPDGAVACVHYARQGKTSFGAPTVFRGAFDFGKDGCPTMDAPTLAGTTADHTSLHVKISGCADAVELVLLAEVGEDADGEAADMSGGGQQLWYDVGVPRDIWRLPLSTEARNAALDGQDAASLAFQRGVTAHFGPPGSGQGKPSYFAFTQAMAVLVAGCKCPNGHQRPGAEL